MSRKQRAMKTGPFAFVQLINKQDALKPIRNFDGLIIRGCAIKMKEAKYSREAKNRKESNISMHGEMENNRKKVNRGKGVMVERIKKWCYKSRGIKRRRKMCQYVI